MNYPKGYAKPRLLSRVMNRLGRAFYQSKCTHCGHRVWMVSGGLTPYPRGKWVHMATGQPTCIPASWAQY